MILLSSLLLACSSPEPYEVVVLTAGGIDPGHDASLARRVGELVAPYGFDVTVEPTPLATGDALADSARAAATRAGAAHAVVLELASREERDGLVDGTHLYAVRLIAHVVHADTERPVPTQTLEWTSEARAAADVERRVVDTWVRAAGPWAVSRLYETPEITRLQEGDVDLDDLAVATAVEENGKKVWLRTEREKDFHAYCQEERERLESFADSDGVRCFGDPCGQATLIGVDGEGRAIVQDISRAPMFSIPPRTSKRSWLEPPERIFAVPLDAPDQAVDLVRSGNLYGFGHVGPGADAGVVEMFSAEGTTGVYGFSLARGERQALGHLGKEEETRFSRAAPDGSSLLYCVRYGDCWLERPGHSRKLQRGFDHAELLALPEGLRIVGPLDGGIGIDDPSLSPDAQPDPIPFEHSVTHVLGVHDGQLQLMASDRYGTCALVRLDPVARRITETLELPHCLRSPQLVPDGRIVGTAQATSAGDIPGDDEIVVWEPGTELAIPLTSGPLREEYPRVTRDGTRVVFNRRLEAPPEAFDTELHRRVVCVTDLP